jgi:CS domain
MYDERRKIFIIVIAPNNSNNYCFHRTQSIDKQLTACMYCTVIHPADSISCLLPSFLYHYSSMSKLSEYSKFDKLDMDNSDEDDEDSPRGVHHESTSTSTLATDSLTTTGTSTLQQPTTPHHNDIATTPSSSSESSPPTTTTGINNNKRTGPCMRQSSKAANRYVYEYNGHKVYEWEQNLEEVILYIVAPPNKTTRQDIHCQISPHHLKLGITKVIQQTGRYFIDEATFGTVDVDESTWTMEEEEEDEDNTMMIVIYLAKANKAQVWDVALTGTLSTPLDPFAKQQVQQEMMLERFQSENPGFDFRNATFNGSVPDPRTFMDGVKYS